MLLVAAKLRLKMQRQSCHLLAARPITSFVPPRAGADLAKPGYSEVVSVAGGTSSSNPASSSGESANHRSRSPERPIGRSDPSGRSRKSAEELELLIFRRPIDPRS